MRHLPLVLVLVACSGDATGALGLLSCPWTRKGETRLAAAPEGTCWQVEAPPGMAVTVPAGDACAADRSDPVMVWPPGQRLALWAAWNSSGDLHVDAKPVPCP